jgi:hypothetical protein
VNSTVPPRLSDPYDSRVVLVGTARYTDPDLPDLPAVENDLTSLRAAFTEGPWGLPPERCRVLLDEENPHVVEEALREAADDAGDTVIFYFAGHGSARTSFPNGLTPTFGSLTRTWRS